MPKALATQGKWLETTMWFFRKTATRFLVLTIVVAIQMVYGCAPPNGNAPPIEIEVRQIDGRVNFESILQDKILFFVPYPVSLRVSTLTVRDSTREVIWIIEDFSAGSRPAVQEVQYGVVPEGFRQRVPKEGRPPSLKIHAEYDVEVRWGVIRGRTTFIYEGPE